MPSVTSSSAKSKTTPYRFDPSFERAVVHLCATDPAFFERLGRHVEVEALSDAGVDEDAFVRRAPGKLAMEAARAIAARAGRGPSSATEVAQELRRRVHEGGVTSEEAGAVRAYLDATARYQAHPGPNVVAKQLVDVLRPRMIQRALTTGMSEWSARDLGLPQLKELLAAADALGGPAAASGSEVVVESLDAVRPEAIKWLWRDRVALGKLALLDGDPGLGKSLITCDLAARLTRGEAMPGDEGRRVELGDVLMISAEDGKADVIVPRLMAAGANLSRVHTLRFKAKGLERLLELTTDDLRQVEGVVGQKSVKLVVLDPLMAFVPDKVDSHRDHNMRRALGPLVSLAECTGAAALVVRHLNKSAGGGAAIYRGGGSIGITGAARSVLLAAKHPDDERLRVLASVKTNVSAAAPSLCFAVVSDVVTFEGEPIPTARIDWRGIANYTADGLLATPLDPEERSAVDEAADFLRDALAMGERPATEVEEEAKAAQVSKRTLRRARKRLDVRARKLAGERGGWAWRLPPGESKEAKGDPTLDFLAPLASFPPFESKGAKGSKKSTPTAAGPLAPDLDLDAAEPAGGDASFDFGANVSAPEAPPPPPPHDDGPLAG